MKENPNFNYRSLPTHDEASNDSIDYEDKVPVYSHHHQISVSSTPQQEMFAKANVCSRPTCSRRLFDSQYQSSVGDLLPSTKTVPVPGVVTSVQFQPSVPSYQYSSTILSNSQIHTAPYQTTLPSPAVAEDKLSVPVSDFNGSVITSVEVLKAIWRNAFELLNEPKSVSPAPGQGDNARMVKSYSGPRHLVTRMGS